MSVSSFTKRGILIGVRDVVFAKLTDDDSTGTTYESTLKSAPGVIEIGLTAKTTSETLGADDIGLYEVFNSADGFDVTLNVASLGADGEAYLLGQTADTKGVTFTNAADSAPYVAMGFKAARSDGTDDYIWLYKGRFALSDQTFHTKEQGTVNWQTANVKATFIPRISDKRIKASVNTAESTASSILASFFTAVYETPSSNPGTM